VHSSTADKDDVPHESVTATCAALIIIFLAGGGNGRAHLNSRPDVIANIDVFPDNAKKQCGCLFEYHDTVAGLRSTSSFCIRARQNSAQPVGLREQVDRTLDDPKKRLIRCYKAGCLWSQIDNDDYIQEAVDTRFSLSCIYIEAP